MGTCVLSEGMSGIQNLVYLTSNMKKHKGKKLPNFSAVPLDYPAFRRRSVLLETLA